MEAPSWCDELDLHAGPPEAAMGTRALDPDRWVDVDAAQQACALELVRTRRDDVVAGSAPDAARSLEAEVVRAVGDSHVEDPDPLVRARLRVAADLCILTPSDGGWVLAAGCVCFPSYWRLQDKVGRPLSAVHEPVPGYDAITARVDGFLTRLRAGQCVWRRNWSIHGTGDLFVPSHVDAPLAPPGERWLRTELQTLRRVDGVDAVVFTIRTQQVQLRDLGDRRAELLPALAGWTDRQRAYKGGAVDDALLEWLRTGRPA